MKIKLESAEKKIKDCESRIASLEEDIEIEKEENEELEKELKEEWLMKEEEYKEEAEWHRDEMARLIMRLRKYGEVFDVDDED